MVQLASTFLLKDETKKNTTVPMEINFMERSKGVSDFRFARIHHTIGPTRKPAKPICNPKYSKLLLKLKLDDGLSKK